MTFRKSRYAGLQIFIKKRFVGNGRIRREKQSGFLFICRFSHQDPCRHPYLSSITKQDHQGQYFIARMFFHWYGKLFSGWEVSHLNCF